MTSTLHFRLLKFASLVAIVCISGCAVYHAVALPPAPDLASTPALTVPASEFWLPGLKPRPFPTNGLDETAVVTLAVFNNPDLKAARLEMGVASAQLFQAGLLPDPQLTADFAKSHLNYGAKNGLREDKQAQKTRAAAEDEDTSHERQV